MNLRISKLIIFFDVIFLPFGFAEQPKDIKINSVSGTATVDSKTGKVEKMKMSGSVSLDGYSEIPYLAMSQQEIASCKKLIESLGKCVPAKCSSKNKMGDILEFELKKSNKGACGFVETNTIDGAAAKSTCDIPAQNIMDLYHYLVLKVFGGTAYISSCFIPSEDLKGKVKDEDLKCKIKYKDKTFYDILQFGEAKGFCKNPHPS